MPKQTTILELSSALALIACSLSSLEAGVVDSYPTAVFSFENHPDLPLVAYAQGRLGIVQPTYARSYLYVAYRWMQGSSLTEEEITQVARYWDERLQATAKGKASPTAAEVYDAARGTVSIPWQAPETPNNFANSQHLAVDYVYYSKCADDAFRKAADTLTARIRQFGEHSREVSVWVRGQDYVFENCFGARTGFIPPEAPTDVDPLIRRDREYQIAAALFYSSRYDEATSAFHRIAADTASPWSGWGRYLAGRARLWDARTNQQDSGTYRVKLYQAVGELRIAQHEGCPEAQEAARWLAARILMRLEPAKAAQILSERLRSPKENAWRASDLRLFTQVLDNLAADPAALREARREDDLVDWIFTFQNHEADHALERWRESKSAAWLAAALSSAAPDEPVAEELLRAAAEAGKQPASPTLAYHRAMLLGARGRRGEAAAIADGLVNDLQGLHSSSNRALGLRAGLAKNAREVLLFGIRPPALLSFARGPSGHVHAWQFQDLDAERRAELVAAQDMYWGPETAEILNEAVGVDGLAAMALLEGPRNGARTELLLAAWTRALLLERWDLVRSLAGKVAEAVPSIRDHMESLLAARAPDGMRYCAVRALLQMPGASVILRSGPLRLTPVDQVDPGGWNWWPKPSGDAAIVDLLAEDQRRVVKAEWDRIRAAGDGYVWLLRQAMLEASLTKPPPDAAETLYHALACSKAVAVSRSSFPRDPVVVQAAQKQAISALRRHFPASDWSSKLAKSLP